MVGQEWIANRQIRLKELKSRADKDKNWELNEVKRRKKFACTCLRLLWIGSRIKKGRESEREKENTVWQAYVYSKKKQSIQTTASERSGCRTKRSGKSIERVELSNLRGSKVAAHSRGRRKIVAVQQQKVCSANATRNKGKTDTRLTLLFESGVGIWLICAINHKKKENETRHMVKL